MTTLLVQGCSDSKNRTTGAVPALELYTGYFFKIIHKSRGEKGGELAVDVCILSAEHGLLDPETEIEPYDRRMDSERAAELRPEVLSELTDRVAGTYDRVVVVGGAAYRAALDGLADEVEAEVHYVRGDGIGEMGHKLKRFLNGDTAAIVDETPDDNCDGGRSCAASD